MKKLPIGLQDFEKIRQGNYLYIDKTQEIFNLIEFGSYLFFTRPRRFGKSLTVSTMYQLFRGNRALFEGLWIENNWDWTKTHPVIWLRFATMGEQSIGLEAGILKQLRQIADGYGVSLDSTDYIGAFEELIRVLHREFGRVVLLIDEYDKPLVDHMNDRERLEQNRQTLRGFYAVVKDADPYLEFFFITGVSAFSKVSLFSALNNLQNVTLQRVTETLTGLTEAEIDAHLTPYLRELPLKQLQHWYNGYSWTGNVRVYNPFSLMCALNSGNLHNFWIDSGTPNYLTELLREHDFVNLEFSEISQSRLTTFEPTDIDPVGLLFQTGYLTITGRDELDHQAYYLDYPNLEVRQSLQTLLLRSITSEDDFDTRARANRMTKALLANDLPQFFVHFNALLAGVPYDLWNRDGEFVFHAVFYLAFELIGVPIMVEVHTKHGRADAVVELPEAVYGFEFKADASVRSALEQIYQRSYLAPFRGSGRRLIAVGVKYDSSQREVVDWKAEVLN